MTCPLCLADVITERRYEDERCWIARCQSHPDKFMAVLKRHVAQPSSEEMDYLAACLREQVGVRQYRGPQSIPEHFHIHEV